MHTFPSHKSIKLKIPKKIVLIIQNETSNEKKKSREAVLAHSV